MRVAVAAWAQCVPYGVQSLSALQVRMHWPTVPPCGAAHVMRPATQPGHVESTPGEHVAVQRLPADTPARMNAALVQVVPLVQALPAVTQAMERHVPLRTLLHS